ncbi:hypothetical protein KIW84_025235 [Lathyrus oleraceus]|uniref:Tf2-1-like SH3-like domain-containing protein n=1 Tax=Pisum sativum TaxID=3888 RepID=A0A9D5BDF4_PEA|nr:hypothetical protein KIW84_025235 [Pisum sativum]
MAPPIIPWNCLVDFEKPFEHTILAPNLTNPKSPKSFVDAVNNVCDIPLSQLPKSYVKGDRITISIPEEEYQIGLEACKHNLHGLVIWQKGSTPLIVATLKTKLSTFWKSIGNLLFVKLRPRRQNSVEGRRMRKPSNRFYGPFKTMKVVGEVAFQMELATTSKIHLVSTSPN